MPRFHHTTQKFDQNGNKVPKGLNGLRQFQKDNPNTLIFDSKSEYELYLKFREMEQKGEISNLECKKKFDLVPKRKWWNNVKKRWDIIREISYITDFTFERDGQKVAVDCKGWKFKMDKKSGKEKWQVYYDEIYKVKKKLFLWLHCGKDGYIFEEM